MNIHSDHIRTKSVSLVRKLGTLSQRERLATKALVMPVKLRKQCNKHPTDIAAVRKEKQVVANTTRHLTTA